MEKLYLLNSIEIQKIAGASFPEACDCIDAKTYETDLKSVYTIFADPMTKELCSNKCCNVSGVSRKNLFYTFAHTTYSCTDNTPVGDKIIVPAERWSTRILNLINMPRC